ncbi:hypothetical protein [Kitasatospora sp. SUK 42]|uniref:hypothetical protein n=1 Tax=Kitasatospora sp. SUK 42 TaxID=1588882 RepID=UPI0018CAED5E|nr:hypothetical protein [Kitasatospora sp. SUK 42]MBV2155062.1 hypothetical protein [Kitasatospora sp. SUK 42]
MNLSSDQPDVEQAAAVALRSAAAAAHAVADLAVSDDRYDQVAALIAASFATKATIYLPLPDSDPEDSDCAADHNLVGHLAALADALDELGRRSLDIRQMRDRHMAALHTRDAATALRNALPVEQGTAG